MWLGGLGQWLLMAPGAFIWSPTTAPLPLIHWLPTDLILFSLVWASAWLAKSISNGHYQWNGDEVRWVIVSCWWEGLMQWSAGSHRCVQGSHSVVELNPHQWPLVMVTSQGG